ncbi:MAG: hypothetical protein DRP03_02380 [Candidatus Aenigmatarchaeota archaeon]|nr:MAG: hypothetical protein DRP03_02380 [Candidatus Aenigmarchaeota archaeon]
MKGMLYSEELGIDVRKREGREKWFIASILFGKRISENIAKRTYKEFEKRGYVNLANIRKAGWDKLVDALDAGGYVRYDFSTADRLLSIAKEVKERYGSVEGIHEKAKDKRDLERILVGIKGIGKVTMNIFLRELRTVWQKADPEPLPVVKEIAHARGVKLPKNRKTEEFIRLECKLLRLRKVKK